MIVVVSSLEIPFEVSTGTEDENHCFDLLIFNKNWRYKEAVKAVAELKLISLNQNQFPITNVAMKLPTLRIR